MRPNQAMQPTASKLSRSLWVFAIVRLSCVVAVQGSPQLILCFVRCRERMAEQAIFNDAGVTVTNARSIARGQICCECDHLSSLLANRATARSA